MKNVVMLNATDIKKIILKEFNTDSLEDVNLGIDRLSDQIFAMVACANEPIQEYKAQSYPKEIIQSAIINVMIDYIKDGKQMFTGLKRENIYDLFESEARDYLKGEHP